VTKLWERYSGYLAVAWLALIALASVGAVVWFILWTAGWIGLLVAVGGALFVGITAWAVLVVSE
jgi:hypothetical protein